MFQDVCRVCAYNTNKANAIHLFLNGSHKALQQINLLTGILVSVEICTTSLHICMYIVFISVTQLQCEPDLPDWMCEKCHRDLSNASDFRERCVRSQKIFEESEKGDKSSPPTAVNRNPRLVCLRPSRSCRSWNQLTERPEVEMPLSPLEVMIKLEGLSNSDAIANGDDGVDHLGSSQEAGLENTIMEMSVSENESLKPASAKRCKRRGRPKSGATCKKRSKASLTVFFCDQCGTNITGKSSFDRHLRKHSGIRPYQCQLCPARFLSAGELKGHQVMHTGDRNFPCRYCERSYVNYSGRMRHERTHTNDRPFACHQCGKTFTNSYILKNHMLIHTGERLFRCELCQRSFARPTHLNTHYRSNTHKHNLEKAKTESIAVQTQPQTQPPSEQSKFPSETGSQPESITFTIELPLSLEQEQSTSLELTALGSTSFVYRNN
ncbi:hypothetical protein KR018_003773 [Drosophila ironensis]|nr:hypothetical protein KR018_003773 [Drosophila ironensis]